MTLYYIYLIRCNDDSLYCGITTDVERRFSEHLNGNGVGAKYTRSRKPKNVEAIWSCDNRSDATKLECAIKKLRRNNKEELINNSSLFNDFFSDKIDVSLFVFEEKYLAEIKSSVRQAP